MHRIIGLSITSRIQGGYMAQTPATQNLGDMNWRAIGDETVEYLCALLCIDTTNPPGHEIAAAEYLKGVLEREGIEAQIVGPDADRATLVARLRGDGTARPLLLMSHTDVVPVERDKWTHDPFGGEIVDGFIYGRGALDMKYMVAYELATMVLLKRQGVPLKRDVIFMASADEEAGGGAGAGWVAQHHPELIQAEYALNEGGGIGLPIAGRTYYTIQVAEKGSGTLRIRATGQPGHASVPIADNAILKLAAVLNRLRDFKLPVEFTKTFRAFVQDLAAAQPPQVAHALLSILENEANADAIIQALPLPDALKGEFAAMIRTTTTPTMLQAGSRINVIPSVAEAKLDLRTLPGWTAERVLEHLRPVLGDEAEADITSLAPALEQDPDSDLMRLIQEVIKERDPEGITIPYMMAAVTDAKRVAHLGIKVYGFAPGLNDGPEMLHGIHGHDERISVRSLHWGIRTFYEVVARFCA